MSRVVRKPWTPGWLLEQGHLHRVGEFEGALHYARQQWLEGHGAASCAEHLGLSDYELHCYMKCLFVGEAMTTVRLAQIVRDSLAKTKARSTP